MPHTTLALIKIHFTDHKVHRRGDLGGFSIFANCATITKINSRTAAPRPVLDVSRQRNHTLWVLLCLPLSLSIVFSGSLHVVMSVRASPLFLVEGHSRVEGHVCSLGCVGLVAVMSLAAVDACAGHTGLCGCVLGSPGCILSRLSGDSCEELPFSMVVASSSVPCGGGSC